MDLGPIAPKVLMATGVNCGSPGDHGTSLPSCPRHSKSILLLYTKINVKIIFIVLFDKNFNYYTIND